MHLKTVSKKTAPELGWRSWLKPTWSMETRINHVAVHINLLQFLEVEIL